jgi:hypothetical protein
MAEKAEETVQVLETHEPINKKLMNPTTSQHKSSAKAEFASRTIHTAKRNAARRITNGTNHGSNSR